MQQPESPPDDAGRTGPWEPPAAVARLRDRYEVLRELGRGGMGVV